MHGVALNVSPAMHHFSLINPCGFSDRRATSMKELTGSDIPLKKVADSFVRHFADVFAVELTVGDEHRILGESSAASPGLP
jgi:lipoyl(octanoyl) transferase